MGRFIDESGNKYGNLTVLDLAAAVPGNPGAMWLCRCESCGRELTIRGRALRFNQPTACIACCKFKFKHEVSKSPEYHHVLDERLEAVKLCSALAPALADGNTAFAVVSEIRSVRISATSDHVEPGSV